MGWAWLSVFLPSSIPPDITIRDKITLETSFCHLIFWGYSLFWGRNFFLNRSSQPLPVSRSQSTLCASLQPPLFFPHLTLCVPQRVAQAPPWLLSQRGAPSALHPPPSILGRATHRLLAAQLQNLSSSSWSILALCMPLQACLKNIWKAKWTNKRVFMHLFHPQNWLVFDLSGTMPRFVADVDFLLMARGSMPLSIDPNTIPPLQQKLRWPPKT